MSFQRERCVIFKVCHSETGDIAYVDEEDVDDLVAETDFAVVARAVVFFEPVQNGEN